MKISKNAVKNPLIVTLFTIFFLVVILMGVFLIPLEFNPEIIAPIVTVTINYTGASPREIENEIVKKLETHLKNVPNIKNVDCVCVNSRAIVTVTFYENVEIFKAKIDVRNAVSEAIPDMPKDIDTPVISTTDITEQAIFVFGITGDFKNISLMNIICEKIKNKFENIEHVKSVIVSGNMEREILISINPLKLYSHKISLNYLMDRIKNSNSNYPGGKLKIKNNEYSFQIQGKFSNLEDLKNTIILTKETGTDIKKYIKIIRLKDIAHVKMDLKQDREISMINGKPGIWFSIYKKKGHSTLEAVNGIKKIVSGLNERILIPAKLKYQYLFDQSYFIHNDINELFVSMFQGMIAIFIILWIGMGIRNAGIAAIGIPFCVIITIGTLYFIGSSLNGLTQLGLMIVMGMIVDGAIVVLEVIYRNVNSGLRNEDAVSQGLDEVGSGVLSSVLTTMCAFAPLLFMSGYLGKYMAEIPKSVLIALFASIIFDHILIPVIAKKLIKTKKVNKQKTSTLLHRIYIKIIYFSANHRRATIILTLFVFIIGVAVFINLPQELIPSGDSGQIYLDIELYPLATKEQTFKVVKDIENNVLRLYKNKKIIKNYLSLVNSTNVKASGNINNSARANILIELVKHGKRKNFPSNKMENIIRKYVSVIPGVKFEIKVPGSGIQTGDPINIEISGDEIKVLKKISRKIQKIINSKVKNVVNLKDNFGKQVPIINAKINREKVYIHGISIESVCSGISALYNGYELTKYYLGNNEIPVVLKLSNTRKNSLNSLKRIYFLKSNNEYVKLTELANIKITGGLTIITRKNYSRVITISGRVVKRGSIEVMKDIINVLKNFKLPAGYTLKYSGENEELDKGMQNLIYAFIAGLILMYIIIVLQLNSFLQPISILITLLLSIAGVSLGLLISGAKVGFMAMFGIVALAGIVVNDAIVLITYINLLRKQGLNKKDAIIQAGKTRLKPILLTTFTTIGGLLPLALNLGGAMSAHWVPMAWAIIGGLLLATLQTLIAVPVVYSYLDDFKNFAMKIKNRIKH